MESGLQGLQVGVQVVADVFSMRATALPWIQRRANPIAEIAAPRPIAAAPSGSRAARWWWATGPSMTALTSTGMTISAVAGRSAVTSMKLSWNRYGRR